MMRVAFFIFLLGLMLSAPFFEAGLAYAKSTKELEAEIAELKRIHDTQTLNLATALNQIQEVLNEFQKMHGQVDQSLYQGSQNARQITDNERAIQVLEDKARILLQQMSDMKKAGLMPTSSVKSLDEFRALDRALIQVNAQEHVGAAKTLQSFLTKYPKSPYADTAQYWLGETYYSLKDYPHAILELQKVVTKYPKSDKIPAALLTQGFAFFERQSLAEAKAFLEKLISKYPNSPEALRAGGRIKDINKILELKKKEELEKATST